MTGPRPMRHPEDVDRVDDVDRAPEPGRIEVGVLVAGRLPKADREALLVAHAALGERLQGQLPEFRWRLTLHERRDVRSEPREEPVRLLELGVAERDARGWDFALVVTRADLVSRYQPYALGVPSRSLGVGVLSTARIDPEAEEPERVARLADRLRALAQHVFGHLNGLEHDGEGRSPMHDVASPADLDERSDFTPDQRAALREELQQVADLRLEEDAVPPGGLVFYVRAIWTNRPAIASAVRLARPWLLPMRLGRLTAAAASALIVLLTTGEVWELGMSQRAGSMAGLSAFALVGTTAYVVIRQRLLRRRGQRRLTEQIVTGNVAITLTVAFGLVTTYVALFAAVLALAGLLYPAAVVESWTAALGQTPVTGHYLRLAGLVASLGLGIGALGASFEEQSHFRHMAYVDEET